MDRLIYSSLAAMRGAMSRQATIGNNLANINTTGFRGEMTHAQSMWLAGKGLDTRATVSGEVSGADMSAGAISATGRNLDIAIDGDAMLSVQAADGSEAYTRRGDLMMNDSGLLTTGDGKPVLGEGGPITLPPYDSLTIGKDGTISIVPVGGKAQDVQIVDRLKLVSPKGSQIAKGLDGLFRETSNGTLPADPDASLTAGSLEGSNVNASSSLIDMIDASRSWETQVKMLTTAQDLDKASADLMRLPD
jgi:flagellar basal-body rod protein FlgF